MIWSLGQTFYFIDHAPEHGTPGNGAGDWHNVGCNNLIADPSPNFFDHASSYGWPLNEKGKYTWPIHAKWGKAGSGVQSGDVPGWTDQKHELFSNGTMTIEKFGKTISRPITGP